MEAIIKQAKHLIAENKVKKTSETIWQVSDKIVKLHIKPGRSSFSCTCKNFVRYNRENPTCVHKTAVILFEANFKFYERLDKLIKAFENFENMKMKPDNLVIVEELKMLKYLK